MVVWNVFSQAGLDKTVSFFSYGFIYKKIINIIILIFNIHI